MKRLRNDPRFATAAAHFTQACANSREWDSVAYSALARYGDHGAQISGILRDHFPDDVKETLRGLARAVSTESDAAWRARPPRVRVSTMRRLAQEIARADGSGFYGPRGD